MSKEKNPSEYMENHIEWERIPERFQLASHHAFINNYI